MILGIQIQPYMLIVGGAFLLIALVLQILVGVRKIRFRGKRHMQVHKALAWLMLVGALLHGLAAAAYFIGA